MTRITASAYAPAPPPGNPAPRGWGDVLSDRGARPDAAGLLMPDMPFVLLDDVGGGSAFLFREPRAVLVARSPGEVGAVLDAVRQAVAAGDHVAGYLAYEAGQAFEPRLTRSAPTDGPCAWFGRFAAPERIDELDCWLPPAASAWNGAAQPRMTRAVYDEAVATILRLIGEGELYQANLTFAATVAVAGPPLALYARLREAQQARWGGVVFTGERWLLSTSPELFFTCVDGALTARPMKGTRARGASSGEDEAAAAALHGSEKDRAENLMIVDLMRNDLGRIARTGSVSVPELFAIERYPTVWQMTSTVAAALRPELDSVDALTQLFPCGSVTGAPKIRAMQAIGVTEPSPRGAYTGSIGFVSPGRAAFNVAIRTVAMADSAGEAQLGLGSGIVADSVAADEWDECVGKGAFLTRLRPDVRLLETMRFVPGEGIALIEGHAARIAASACALGFGFTREGFDAALDDALRGACSPSRIRLLLNEDGGFEVTTDPLPPSPPQPVKVALRPLPVEPDDYRLRHKTDDRAFYDRARDEAGTFEVLFQLPDGRLTEGSFTSLLVARGGRLATPAGPLIPGVLRATLIADGSAFEDDVAPVDLCAGFWIGNAVRGLIRAELATD